MRVLASNDHISVESESSVGFRKAVCCVGLLELVSFSSEDSYQLLQVLLFASKDVETRNNQSFPLKLRVLPIACYLTVNLAVYFLKEVPA